MQLMLSLFFKNIFLDTFTLCYKVPESSYISFAVFFLMIWGIKWYSLIPNRIRFATTAFLLCSTRSWGSVGGTATYSTSYHKSAIFKINSYLNIHGTNDFLAYRESPLLQHQTSYTLQSLDQQGLLTPQLVLGPCANHWHNSLRSLKFGTLANTYYRKYITKTHISVLNHSAVNKQEYKLQHTKSLLKAKQKLNRWTVKTCYFFLINSELEFVIGKIQQGNSLLVAELNEWAYTLAFYFIDEEE